MRENEWLTLWDQKDLIRLASWPHWCIECYRCHVGTTTIIAIQQSTRKLGNCGISLKEKLGNLVQRVTRTMCPARKMVFRAYHTKILVHIILVQPDVIPHSHHAEHFKREDLTSWQYVSRDKGYSYEESRRGAQLSRDWRLCAWICPGRSCLVIRGAQPRRLSDWTTPKRTASEAASYQCSVRTAEG